MLLLCDFYKFAAPVSKRSVSRKRLVQSYVPWCAEDYRVAPRFQAVLASANDPRQSAGDGRHSSQLVTLFAIKRVRAFLRFPSSKAGGESLLLLRQYADPKRLVTLKRLQRCAAPIKADQKAGPTTRKSMNSP
jgi:hypothetical protein